MHQADHPFLNNFEGIPYVSDFKYLGVIFSCNSTFSKYVDNIVYKVSKRIYVIRSLKYNNISSKDLLYVYDSLILNVILYAFPLFSSFSCNDKCKLEKIHKRCHNIICNKNCNCKSIAEIATSRSISFFRKCVKNNHILFNIIPRFCQPFT